MKILKITIILFVLIMSLGTVCAADNLSDEIISDDGQDTQITQNNVYATGESSFTSLASEIENAGAVLDLNQDYIFNNETDNNAGILINKDNFILNGNGHTIDGNKQSRIFNITGNNITIKNLILVNGNADKGGAIYAGINIICNNVTFKNNHALSEGGAIYVSNQTNTTGCIFDSNYALKGADIFLKIGELPDYPDDARYSYVEYSTFKNAQNIQQASIFLSSATFVNMTNCLFENITSEYGSAMYADATTRFHITNSSFKNLYANRSGGAFVFIGGVNGDIKNSTFTNCKSIKNGGAIYIDENGWVSGNPSSVNIYGSNFINCTSDFGGAIAQVSGTSEILGCNFTQNSATYFGGAVYYTVLMDLIGITDTVFDNNTLLCSSEDGFFGSAVYSLFTPLKISNSTFLNNLNNSIYCYGIVDNNVSISNSYFKNNGEAIRAVHVKSLNMDNNTLVDDEVKQFDDDEFLNMVITNPAIDLELVNNTINVITLPARYDLRDWGWVSSVKNQGFSGGCWCFATCAALESALLKATGVEYDFSEQNMQKMLFSYSKYGNEKLIEAGQTDIALQYVLSWLGVFPEEYDTFDMYGKITKDYVTPENIHIQDAVVLYANKTNMNDYKKAILKYGAVTTDIAVSYKAPYFNETTYASYYNETADKYTPNHAVAIVGWDDNYPKENFLMTPPGDGAWIIKNSYGEDKYDNGYIYVSYYDTTVAKVTDGVAFSIENTEKYTKNYQTDFGGEPVYLSGNVSYKNSYTALSSDLITAIGTYFNDVGENYSFDVYVNNVLKLTQKGNVTFAGFHTINLEKEIPVKEGDNFTVVMTKNSAPILKLSRIFYKSNTSFYNNGSGWKDASLENLTVILKVYTKDLSIYAEDLVKIYKNDSKFEAVIGIANETVIFEIGGMNYTRVSDENGTVRMAINLGPGNYTVKTIFNGTTVENAVTVLPTLISDNLVKYFRNASQFYVSLIDGEGNPVVGKNITMNINGVFYNRMTNENGTAKLNINLAPGEYILTATDPLTGLLMSYNITVLPVLTASDMEMTYLDGSSFNVKLVDGKGNPLSGASIEMNINGVFYNRTTNASGIAKLNIRLIPGEYIITSAYEGALISNKVTVVAKED